MICNRCDKDKVRIFSGRFHKKGRGRTTPTFVDENNHTWQYGMCPDCRMAKLTAWDRKKGIRPYGEGSNKNTRLGRNNELRVASFFESAGFKVGMTKQHGPDLIITNGEIKYFIEVKTAFNNSLYPSSWKIGRVSRARCKDNFLCIVFPQGFVIVGMKDNARKTGVTNEFNILRSLKHASNIGG